MRKVLLTSLFVFGVTVAPFSQTLADAIVKVDTVTAEAQSVIARNATLKPKSRLPQWVIDTQARILKLAEEAKQIIILQGPARPPQGGGVVSLTPDTTTADCELATVDADLDALTDSNKDGFAFLKIAAGTCQWESSLTSTAPANSVIIGAGSLSTRGGGDVTIIEDDSASSNYLWSIETVTGSFRIAGITFRGGSGETKQSGMLVLAGVSQDVEADHMTFNPRTYSTGSALASLQWTGCQYGVVYENRFLLYGQGNGVRVYHTTCGSGDSADAGDWLWSEETNLGGSNFVFIESNTFDALDHFGLANDCAGGGRFVGRFNDLIATGWQTHPTGGTPGGRGCRAWELYENDWTALTGLGTSNLTIFGSNSGTGVAFNNTTPNPSDFKHGFVLYTVRRTNVYTQTAVPDGWGYCGTSFNGTGSSWDGNNPSAVNGYPCLDQVGRGIGDLLESTNYAVFSNRLNSTTGTRVWPNQALEPAYIWNNPFTTFPGSGGDFMAADATDVVENRDFYDDDDEEVATACTGGGACTAGVGSGTTLPTTCTTGVAFFDTDAGINWNTLNGSGVDGALYKCTSTNNWSLYYTPYPYPHPGRSQ